MKAQLLDLFDTTQSFDNFITISNKIVSEALKTQTNQFTNIIGSKLSGKTHLLKSWVKYAIEQHKSAIYLDANQTIDEDEIRHLATYHQFIAIDNINYLSDLHQIELFDLFNSIKLNNRDNLLLTSSTFSLDNTPNIRNDLRTRILSGLNLILKSPDDDEIMKTLEIYISKEGVTINDAELKYMVTHYTRNIGTLINTIHKIANAAVLEKRNITIPLIKSVIDKI